MMQITRCFLAATFASSVLAQIPTYETPDFNLTQALIDKKVDIAQFNKLTDDSLSTSAACLAACFSIKTLFGAENVASQDTPEYNSFVDGYWSAQQAAVRPRCVFFPSSSSDVSTFVLIARTTRCPFAIRSGGHGAFPGSSNSIGGITVALGRMKDITLSDDKKLVSVRPGNVWSEVYAKLVPYDLAAIGGRVADIGVGGLLLGGGISFLSNKHGWGCDNVESYEVVIANGEIVTASETSHPDLYWALRGGGNNFGIVTRFNLFTYELGTMYGGTVVFENEQLEEAMQGYHHSISSARDDPDGMTFFVEGTFNKSRMLLAELAYAKDDTNAPGFAKYLEIPTLHDARISRKHDNYTWKIKESNPDGLRQIFHTITTKVNPEFTKFAFETWREETKVMDKMPNNVVAFILHPITMPVLENMEKRGGNALGLSKEGGPYQINQVAMMWSKEEDDIEMYRIVDDFYGKISRKAKEMGIMHDFIYSNYGSMFQDVIASYGPANKARLEAISAKYDPKQIFQTLQPGYFKLKGGPYKSYQDWLAKTQVDKSAHDEL